MAYKYPLLMQEGKMGNLELENRVVAAPMGTLNGDTHGFVTDNAIEYYTRLAKGGMGLIIVESVYTDTLLSKSEDNELGIWSNEHTTGWARLVSAVHDQGAKVVMQLSHIGHQISLADHMESLGPSTMVEMMGPYPFPIRGATIEEIEQIIQDFATCAWRAKKAGFDGVEIHGAIGHLIAMFCTPFYNKRTDKYGGSPENRGRFMVDIVKAVRKKCGKSFPIISRVTGCDFDDEDEGGLTLKEGILHAKMLEEAGSAALHVIGGSQRNVRVINCQYDPRGEFACISEAMKKAGIKIPIILDGGLTTPDLAQKVLEEGKADFVGLGRPMLADPDWAKKVRENREEDIIPCIRCLMGCVGSGDNFNAAIGVRCSVNPMCNMTAYRKIEPAETKKKICVIGGGPAGMEAARVAALRGHDVTLYEKRKLGGVMHEAAFDMSFKEDIKFLIDYYATQMEKLPIKVVYEEINAEKVLAEGYDAAIVATGMTPLIPKSARESKKIIPLIEFAKNADMELGERILMVGGCFPNVEMAYSLAKKGKKVTISTRRGKKNFTMDLGKDNSGPSQQRLLKLLMDYDVDIRMGKHFLKETENGALLSDVDSKVTTEIPCDNIILCRGYVGNAPKIYDELKGNMEVYKIGDSRIKSRCDQGRTIGDSILEGWQVGNRI